MSPDREGASRQLSEGPCAHPSTCPDHQRQQDPGVQVAGSGLATTTRPPRGGGQGGRGEHSPMSTSQSRVPLPSSPGTDPPPHGPQWQNNFLHPYYAPAARERVCGCPGGWDRNAALPHPTDKCASQGLSPGMPGGGLGQAGPWGSHWVTGRQGHTTHGEETEEWCAESRERGATERTGEPGGGLPCVLTLSPAFRVSHLLPKDRRT